MALAVAAVGARQAFRRLPARTSRAICAARSTSMSTPIPTKFRDRSMASRPRGSPKTRDARDRAEEPLGSNSRACVALAQGGARHRGVRRHRSQPARRRHECARRRKHGAGNGGWGRMVWMSTFDSENQIRVEQVERAVRPGLAERRAAARDESRNCGDRQAQSRAGQRACVGAGSAADVRGRARLGVRAMVATHGMSTPTSLTVEQARQATKVRRLHRVHQRHAGKRQLSGQDRSHRPATSERSASITRSCRPISGRRATRCRPTACDVHGGDAQERVHQSGARSDDQAEPGAIAGSSKEIE